MPTYGQIQNGQIWLGSAGWQPIPKGTIGNPPTKPSTVKAPTKASTISAVAHIGQYTPQLAQVTEPPVVSEISAPLGQAFPRQEANLTPSGVVSAGVSAMRRQTYPRGEPIRGAVGTERTRTIGEEPYRIAAYDQYGNPVWRRIGTPAPAFKNQLEYLDQLSATDPERAAEVARFQAATIGRANPESALATNVFFTEKSIRDGVLARNASEQVWDMIAARMGLDISGAELLRQRGYVPIGGGLWYLGRLGGGAGSSQGAASPRQLSVVGGGGGGGGGDGGDGGGSRFLSNASAGLFNWRIGA